MTLRALLLSLTALAPLAGSSGCAGGAPRLSLDALTGRGLQRGAAVEVLAADEDRGGRGAVVAPDRVLTVGHVLGEGERAWVSVGRGWVSARVARRLEGRPEPLVELQLELDDGWLGEVLGFTGFAPERVHRRAPAPEPAWIATERGLQPFEAPDRLRPGDSGSPVLDYQLRLVGLLMGRRAGRAIVIPVRAGPSRARVCPPLEASGLR